MSRELAPGEVASTEVVRAVRDMYQRHPFPPAQRKHSYQRHAAYVRSFLAERGIDPRGATFGDIACGTGLMMLDYAREFPETTFVFCRHGQPDAGRRIGRQRAGLPAGHWERRVQQEILRTITADQMADDDARIEAVRTWAQGDRNFKNYYTAPPVDLTDDNWVVDEFLHVWEQHVRLTDVVSWLRGHGMQVQRMTDYYDQEIPLDVTYHSSSPVLAEKVGKLPFESQCHVIDMIVRPYWISLFAQKSSG